MQVSEKIYKLQTSKRETCILRERGENDRHLLYIFPFLHYCGLTLAQDLGRNRSLNKRVHKIVLVVIGDFVDLYA
jgi:hypothetical protein